MKILLGAVRSYLTHRAKGVALDNVLRLWALPSRRNEGQPEFPRELLPAARRLGVQ
jgi:hypothetical protein